MTYLADIPRARQQPRATASQPLGRSTRTTSPVDAPSRWNDCLAEMNTSGEPNLADRIESAMNTGLVIGLAMVGLIWAADAIWMAVVVDPMLGDF